MRLLGGKTAYRLSCGKQPLFPSTDTKFQVKGRMKCGWVQAEDIYVIIIFFENSQAYPGKPLKFGRKSPGKEFHFTVGRPVIR